MLDFIESSIFYSKILLNKRLSCQTKITSSIIEYLSMLFYLFLLYAVYTDGVLSINYQYKGYKFPFLHTLDNL